MKSTPFELSDLSQQQRILLNTDGTVTDLIRLFTGEEIRVTKLSQEVVVSAEPDGLQLEKASRLLLRRILLTGNKHYLYAESYFVIDRMSEFLREQLLDSNIPIGLLWQQEKLETFREILAKGCEEDAELLDYFSDLKQATFLARTYRIYHGGLPLGLITEKFPSSYFC